MKKMKTIAAVAVVAFLVASVLTPAIAGVNRLVYLDSQREKER